MRPIDWYCDEVLSGLLTVDRLFEDDLVLAFHHPRPAASPHVVVIPKQHIPSLLAPEAGDGTLLTSMVMAVQHAATVLGVDRDGGGFYVRANAGAVEVTPHMHWHLLPGAISNWPRLGDA